MFSEPTISVSTIIDVYYILLEKGIDEGVLEAQSGVALSKLEDPDARVSISTLNTLWDIAIEYTQNPAIGLYVGNRVDPNRLSVVAQASFQCETILQGLQKYVTFFSIVNQAANMAISVKGELATLEFRFESPEFYSIPEIERMMASALARCRYLVGDTIKPKQFSFQHPCPDYLIDYQEAFKAPLLFNQDKSAIVFERSLLDTKIKHRNPYLMNVMTNYAEKLLKKIQPSSDVQKSVRVFIKKHLSDDSKMDVKKAAKALHMSRHTLYRKLKKEAVSFQSLVEEVRREEAEQHLKDNKVSISEVAFLLGFSELSAFSRAFKRWTGESPAQYRESNKL